MSETKNGQELLEEAAQDHSLDKLLNRAPPLDPKMRREMIRQEREKRETWEPKQ